MTVVSGRMRSLLKSVSGIFSPRSNYRYLKRTEVFKCVAGLRPVISPFLQLHSGTVVASTTSHTLSKTRPQWRKYATVSTTFTAAVQDRATNLKGSRLRSRSLILVTGRDALELLQGLMTNDVNLLDSGQEVIYSMFLNKQGRVLYDVLCYRWVKGENGLPSYLLECDTAISADLQKHLKFYRIRKKAVISSLDSDYHVWSVFNAGSIQSSMDEPPSPVTLCSQSHSFSDPRVRGLGRRILIPAGHSDLGPEVEEAGEEDYCLHRYQWGVAEGINELPPGDSLPLEANLAYMNGVSFTKGCYLGQELTARTHHTGVIRKRLTPVTLLDSLSHDAAPSCVQGSSIKTSEGKNVGKLRCTRGERGIALLRTAFIGSSLWIQATDGADRELVAHRPSWWPEEVHK